ncbi:MAG: hypothetical protein K1000chlam2_01081, partial [Chlamydiae bacterium]|nr:hypothetical protein [Chlamydiota bacterium]
NDEFIEEAVTGVALFGKQFKKLGVLSYDTLNIGTAIQSDDVESGKKIVGGCGTNLQVQKVQATPKAAAFLENSWSEVVDLVPESWKIVKDAEGKVQGAMFRLAYEDVPESMIDNYQWMESLLLPPQGEDQSSCEERIAILEAMEMDDRNSFDDLIKNSNDLKKLQDRGGRSLLHHAASSQNGYYFSKLIEKGLLHDKDGMGYLPVHYAAMNGSLDVLKQIAGKNQPNMLDARSLVETTPIYVAIQHNQVEAVQFLLGHNPPFSPNVEGYTPLHCALHHGNKEICSLVLAHEGVGSCVNVATEEGQTPLMLATELDSVEYVDVLIKLGAKSDRERKDGVTAHEIAIENNFTEVLEHLLKVGSCPDQAVKAAAQMGSIEVATMLQKPILALKNRFEDTALHIAIRHGNIPVALFFVQKCTNVNDLSAENKIKETAVSLSAELGIWALIIELHRKGVSIDPTKLLHLDYHPLVQDLFAEKKYSSEELKGEALIAAREGNHEALSEIFIPSGVNLKELRDSKGWRVFHLLAKSDGVSLFKYAYRGLFDPLMPLATEQGKTTAFIAAEHGSGRVLKFILQLMKKNNLHLNHHFMDRHLFYAAVTSGKLEICESMTGAYSDIDLPNCVLDSNGTRPVHLAAKLGLLSVLKWLHSKGADLQAQDLSGKTPLDFAVRASSGEMVSFLLSQGVKVTPPALYKAISQEEIGLLFKEQALSKDVLNQSLRLSMEKHDFPGFMKLLEGGADVDWTKDSFSPILFASASGQSNMLQVILKYSQNHLVEGLREAEKNGHFYCRELLLRAQNPNRQGLTNYCEQGEEFKKILIRLSQRKLSPQDIEEILQQFDPMKNLYIAEGEYWGSPLHFLLKFCPNAPFPESYIKTHEKLVTHEDSDGNTIFHILHESGQPTPFKAHSAVYCKKNHNGITPLHFAAQYCQSQSEFREIVQRLTIRDCEECDNDGQSAVFYASFGNKEDNLDILIKKDVNLNVLDNQLLSPLFYCVEKEKLNLVHKLLSGGADPDLLISERRWPVLHLAIEQENQEMTRSLMFHHCDCRLAGDDGIQPIHIAAETGNNTLIRILHAKGIPMDVETPEGLQPIHIAAQHGNTATVFLLAELTKAGIDVPDEERAYTPLHLALNAGKLDTAGKLLLKGADPTVKTKNGANSFSLAAGSDGAFSAMDILTPYRLSNDPNQLFLAAEIAILRDNVDAFVKLYQRGIPVGSELTNELTGLQHASLHGSVQCTQWLLEQGEDPSICRRSGENAFEMAAMNDSYEQFALLLEHASRDLDEKNILGKSLLHISAKAGKLSHITYLIRNGVVINCVDINGDTPLHLAAKAGHVDVVDLLLSCGADPTLKNGSQKTPEDLIEEQNLKTKQLFQDHEKIFNQLIPGDTYLHFAIRWGNAIAVRLLAKTEEINKQNARGETPLHDAVKVSNLDFVLYLINRGAGLNIKDLEEKTPLDMAEGNQKLVTGLKKLGALSGG